MADQAVPGIPDLPGLARWLGGHGVEAGAGLPEVQLIAGGRSNLTYSLRFPAPAGAGSPERLVLRRPPLGHVLPTAHDMSREYRVLSALDGTAVPVPRPVVLCQDEEVIGAPFYVMEYVAGLVLRTREDARLITPGQAGEISRRFAEMLAAIHGLDYERAGLAGFGRPEGYLARQLARWQRQWDLSATRAMPGYEQLVARLAAGLPADGGQPGGGAAGTLVHGDFRLDNMLIAAEPEARIAAVVDWEMSTLGDPLADLGLTLVYWVDPGEEDVLVHTAGRSVTTSPGFLARDELVALYAELTGRDVSRIGYYMAFGCFKLAVVLEGIHARFLQHQTVGEGFEREGQAVPSLIERAHQLLDSAG
jgi:aminoglycoside phosphotransferase (APT) family kinase protein